MPGAIQRENGGHTHMFGFINGMMASGQGYRTLDNGRDVIEMHPGALGIVAGILGIILWVLAATALVLAIITMIRRLKRPGTPPVTEAMAVVPVVPVAPVEQPAETAAVAEPALSGPAETDAAAASALQILNDRFARGEIGQEEYVERRKTLTGGM
jgi:uncharacterized membrane protein